MDSSFHLDQCDKEARADFAMALVKRSPLTWEELSQSPRHALGSELIPVGQFRFTPHERFSDQRKLMVMRYHGKLPMAGVRVGNTYHVLAVEATFNDLYDHGS